MVHLAAVILYELYNLKPIEIEIASKYEFNLLIDHFSKMMKKSGYPPQNGQNTPHDKTHPRTLNTNNKRNNHTSRHTAPGRMEKGNARHIKEYSPF